MSWIEHSKDFQTPDYVAEYMVGMVPKGAKKILEPTPGMGNIVKALNGYQVTAPDDFFLLEADRYDSIVMNPPFSSKFANLENAPVSMQGKGLVLGYQIMQMCMERSDSVICLQPWFAVADSDVRMRAIKDFGLKSVTALPRKVFQYARIQTCILELEKGYKGETLFKVFDRL